MQSHKRADVVTSVLDRMERHAQMTKLAILGAAAAEGLLLVVALLKVNWTDNTQVLLFIFAVLGYTIVALGLVAGGGADRVANALSAVTDAAGGS